MLHMLHKYLRKFWSTLKTKNSTVPPGTGSSGRGLKLTNVSCLNDALQLTCIIQILLNVTLAKHLKMTDMDKNQIFELDDSLEYVIKGMENSFLEDIPRY